MKTETPFLHLLIKEHILIGTYKKDLHIDLDVAQQIVRERISFTGGKKLPAMIMSQGVNSIDRPAREYLASDEGIQGLSATAIVVNSPFGRLMGNFFMMVHKTRIPVKIFSNPRQAALWLRQFADQN